MALCPRGPNKGPHTHLTLPVAQALVSEGGATSTEQQRRARALAQQAGCEARISFELLAQISMSGQGEVELCTLNPLLSEQEAGQVVHRAIAVMLVINRCAHTARALTLARKLQSTLGSLRAGRLSDPEALATASNAQVLADQLAQVLGTERAHVRGTGANFCLDPRLLTFEFSSGVVLRPQQVELLAKLAATATSGRSVCHQMLMGEGKTTVISPLLALLLADGNQLIMQIVPAPLLRFSLDVMRGVFRCGPLHKSIYTFSFNRRSQVTPQLLHKALVVQDERGVMVSTPAAVKAYMLKLLELLHLLDTGQYPRNLKGFTRHIRRIGQMFGLKQQETSKGGLDKPALHEQAERAVQLLQIWRGAVAVIDEVDIVLHPLKSELNWPLGDRHSLDFAPMRWELPWYLISAILRVQSEAASTTNSATAAPAAEGVSVGAGFSSKESALIVRLRQAIVLGQEQKVMQMVPHLVLLNEMFYHEHIKPILAEWLLLWLRRQGLRDITDEQVVARIEPCSHQVIILESSGEPPVLTIGLLELLPLV